MFNNINDSNNDYLYNSQFDTQKNVANLAALRFNATKSLYKTEKNSYVDRSEISSNAIEMFQKDQDIAKFNKIAISDMDNLSHLDKMKELFSSGVVDVYEDDVLQSLVTNTKLWDDLEL